MEENYKMEKDSLEALKRFLKKDLEIKNELMKLAPTPADDFNESTRISYVDRLYDSLKEFEYQFQSSLKGLTLGKTVDTSIKKFFGKLKKNLEIGSYDRGVCQTVFQKCFSDMSNNLIEDVKENFFGYSMFYEAELNLLINKADTINELLHICHSYVMNNERILRSTTELGKKENDFDYSIKLYGEKNEISEELFKNFPLDLDVGNTDIVSIQDQILMMVRDRGHALTLDIDLSQDKPFVKYFIPKICNEDMVRALPGVDIDNISINGALGRFECDKQELIDKLFEFIEKVPMDKDIPSKTENDIPSPIERVDNEENNSSINSIKEDNTRVISKEDFKEMATNKNKGYRGDIGKLRYKIYNIFRGQNKSKDGNERD